MREPHSEFVVITPQMAIEWIKQGAPNRHVREKAVRAYARDMCAGKWSITHQGIAFNSQGMLIDGQHRLHAIVEANRPIKMMVTFNVDDKVNIDTGMRRTVADVVGVSPLVAAIGSALLMFTEGFKWRRATTNELANLIDMHRDAIEFVLEIMPTHKQGIRTAPVLAAFVRASYNCNPERLRTMGEVLTTGYASNPDEDGMAIKLRDYLLTLGAQGSRGIRREAYNKTEYAINLFCQGKVYSRLIEAPTELFPFPPAKQITNEA